MGSLVASEGGVRRASTPTLGWQVPLCQQGLLTGRGPSGWRRSC